MQVRRFCYTRTTLPSGAQLNSQSWSVNGTTVTAWSQTSTDGGYTGRKVNAQFTGQTATFYWIVPANSQTVTFNLSWGVNGHDTTTQARATFNVAGPTSPSVGTPLNPWEIYDGFLSFGNNSSLATSGIQFDGSAVSPAGDTNANNYQWVQILDTWTESVTYGSTTTTCQGPVGLDNTLPYHTGLTTSDSPGMSVNYYYSKETDSMSFHMYFMWYPNTSSTDIPVPLGFVSWSASGVAVQTSGAWAVDQAHSTASASFHSSASYPGWGNLVTNGSFNCP